MRGGFACRKKYIRLAQFAGGVFTENASKLWRGWQEAQNRSVLPFRHRGSGRRPESKICGARLAGNGLPPSAQTVKAVRPPAPQQSPGFCFANSNKFCRKSAPFPFHASFQILTEFAIMCMISEHKLCFATKIAHNFIALQWVA